MDITYYGNLILSSGLIVYGLLQYKSLATNSKQPIRSLYDMVLIYHVVFFHTPYQRYMACLCFKHAHARYLEIKNYLSCYLRNQVHVVHKLCKFLFIQYHCVLCIMLIMYYIYN